MRSIGVTSLFSPIRELAKHAGVWPLYSSVDDEESNCYNEGNWGCVLNRVLSRKYGKFLEGNLPSTIHWMNYWSKEIILAIGMEKIQKIIDQNTVIKFKNGIFSIKNMALDVGKEDDIRFHDELQKQFFL